MKSSTISLGDRAPAFSLPAIDGGEVGLADIAGPVVILVFFRGMWCPACRWQLGHLRDRYDEFIERGATIVAISADSIANARDAEMTASLPFHLLSDERAEVLTSFGLGQMDDTRGLTIAKPAVFVLDRSRIVRYAFVGEHSRDRPAVGTLLLAIDPLPAAVPMIDTR